MAKPTQAPNNPFACGTNAVKMHTVGPCCCVLLAVYEYAVSGGGSSIEFTPLTGNDSADLKYYRFTIFDKFGQSVGGSLDLQNPSAAVVVDTSSLSGGDWQIKFAACKMEGTEECSIGYDMPVYDVANNPSGTSTPANYENVQFVLKLTSTDDAEFVLFPAEGVQIASGGTIDLNDYLDGAALLDNAGSYVFSLEVKKCWYGPTAEQPVLTDNSVVSSFTPETAYPVAVSVAGTQIASALTIATGSTGQFSEVVTVALNNEGVEPSISFTIKTDVA